MSKLSYQITTPPVVPPSNQFLRPQIWRPSSSIFSIVQMFNSSNSQRYCLQNISDFSIFFYLHLLHPKHHHPV